MAEQELVVNPLQGRPPSRYTKVQDLGVGPFGSVILAKDADSGDQVAVKLIDLKPESLPYIQREVENHSRLAAHPNIVRFKDASVWTLGLKLIIEMEYASHGDLQQYVKKSGRLPEDEARYFYVQLLTALDYCHKLNISHRDMKPENLLLSGGREKPVLKLCDFGFSFNEDRGLPTSPGGSPWTAAPEVLANAFGTGTLPVTRRSYKGHAADIWSSGVVLYAMLFGSFPFRGPPSLALVQKILKGVYAFPEGIPVSAECKDFVSQLLVLDPEKRITLDRIKEHGWFILEPCAKQVDETNALHLRNTQAEEEKDRLKDILRKAKQKVDKAYPSGTLVFNPQAAAPAGIPVHDFPQDQQSQRGSRPTTTTPPSPTAGAPIVSLPGIPVPDSNQVRQSQTSTEATVLTPAYPGGRGGSAGGGDPRGMSGQGSTQVLHHQGGMGSMDATLAAFSYGSGAAGPPGGASGPDNTQHLHHQGGMGSMDATLAAFSYGSGARGPPGGNSGPGNTQHLHHQGGMGSMDATLAAFSYGSGAGGPPGGNSGPGNTQLLHRQGGMRSTDAVLAFSYGSGAGGPPGGILGPGGNQVLGLPPQALTAELFAGTVHVGSMDATLAAFSYGSGAGGPPGGILGPGGNQVLGLPLQALTAELSAGTVDGSTAGVATSSEAHDIPGQPPKQRKTEDGGDRQRSPKHTPK